jgi:hypothetical protein
MKRRHADVADGKPDVWLESRDVQIARQTITHCPSRSAKGSRVWHAKPGKRSSEWAGALVSPLRHTTIVQKHEKLDGKPPRITGPFVHVDDTGEIHTREFAVWFAMRQEAERRERLEKATFHVSSWDGKHRIFPKLTDPRPPKAEARRIDIGTPDYRPTGLYSTYPKGRKPSWDMVQRMVW